MSLSVKICGLSTAEAVEAAVGAGTAYAGFVFFARSPRNVTAEKAAELAKLVPASVKTVAVFVDPSDADIQSVLQAHPFDYIQLHGQETVERVRAVRTNFATKVIKAFSVSSSEDIEKAQEYAAVADLLLFDAKAPKSMAQALPGGNGLRFDWELLSRNSVPASNWILSGGLDAENLSEAIRISGAQIVDVSSGVEDGPGIKSLDRIREFLDTATGL